MSWHKQSEKIYEDVGEMQQKVRKIDRLEKSEYPLVVVEALNYYRSKLSKDINSCIEYKSRIEKKGR
jgi:hypothetical protein